MSEAPKSRRPPIWSTAPELPEEVLAAWQKPGRVISPVAIVATVDPDGRPRTAPFGSVKAATPRRLLLFTWHKHDTYANLCRDGRVSVCLVSPDVAVSVRGRARVVREQMEHDPDFATLEIAIEEVKNDMVYRIVIDSGITIHPKERFQAWYDAAMDEMEALRDAGGP
jgi:flavin reductase (DIM6/NTAB) family NADH-FMN oxidoreductase RutF